MRKKLESPKVIEQKGRSLVELLSVLSIAGVLSVAGIYGFQYAMEKWRENETLNRYAKIVASARTSRILEGENEGYRTKYRIEGDTHTDYAETDEKWFHRQPVDIRKVISNVGDDMITDVPDGEEVRPLGYLVAPQKGPFNQFNTLEQLKDSAGIDYELTDDYEPKEVEIWVDARTPSAFTVHASNLTFNTCKRIVQSDLGHNWGYEEQYDHIDINAENVHFWKNSLTLMNEEDANELCAAVVGGQDLVMWFGNYECISGMSCPYPEVITCKEEDLCEADADCESGICRGGCCLKLSLEETDPNCIKCMDDGECPYGQVCNNGCCGMQPYQLCEKEGLTSCTTASDCEPGYMCSDNCCEKMECASDMTCTADSDCVVSDEEAEKNGWKTQGTCSDGCCKMIDCEKPDHCAAIGMDRLYDGTCCPKRRSWFNCGGCNTVPTYIDECGIERKMAKACCDAPSDAPEGCVGTGFFNGYSFPSNYPKCYSNYPDANNSCCQKACAPEDGSSDAVCCDSPSVTEVSGICCSVNSPVTLHCCKGQGYEWASSNLKGAGNRGTDAMAGREGTCCGLPGSGTEAAAYVEYDPNAKKVNPNTAVAKCVPTGQKVAASSQSVKYSTRYPIKTPGEADYPVGFLCNAPTAGVGSGKAQLGHLIENNGQYTISCCDGSIVTDGTTKDGYQVGFCCSYPRELANMVNATDICCATGEKVSKATSSNKDDTCCQLGQTPYGDAQCCAGTVYTDANGQEQCCATGGTVLPGTGSAPAQCCLNVAGKPGKNQICCTSGNAYEDINGDGVCCDPLDWDAKTKTCSPAQVISPNVYTSIPGEEPSSTSPIVSPETPDYLDSIVSTDPQYSNISSISTGSPLETGVSSFTGDFDGNDISSISGILESTDISTISTSPLETGVSSDVPVSTDDVWGSILPSVTETPSTVPTTTAPSETLVTSYDVWGSDIPSVVPTTTTGISVTTTGGGYHDSIIPSVTETPSTVPTTTTGISVTTTGGGYYDSIIPSVTEIPSTMPTMTATRTTTTTATATPTTTGGGYYDSVVPSSSDMMETPSTMPTTTATRTTTTTATATPTTTGGGYYDSVVPSSDMTETPSTATRTTATATRTTTTTATATPTTTARGYAVVSSDVMETISGDDYINSSIDYPETTTTKKRMWGSY